MKYVLLVTFTYTIQKYFKGAMYRGEDPRDLLSKMSTQDLNELTKIRVSTFTLTSIRLVKMSWPKTLKAKCVAELINQDSKGRIFKQKLFSEDWLIGEGSSDFEHTRPSTVFIDREREFSYIQIKVRTSSLIPMKFKTIAKSKPFKIISGLQGQYHKHLGCN